MRKDHDRAEDSNDTSGNDRGRMSGSNKIYSISGLLPNGHALMKYRPFRAPHHNASLNALIGGGAYAMPGKYHWHIMGYCSWMNLLNFQGGPLTHYASR